MVFVPEFFLVIIAIVLVFSKNVLKKDDWIPLAALVALGLAFFWRLGTFGQMASLGDFFVLNDFSWYFDLIYLGVAIVSAIFSFSISKDRNIFFSLMLIGAAGMMLLTKSRDILALFLSIELIALSLYSLVAFGKDERKLEAGIKYFILNVFASALLILGLGIVFALTGATRFSEISNNLTTQMALPMLAGIVFILAGLGFKMGIFPFNFWLPDVYEAAPIGITTLLAGASKKAAFGAVALLLVLGLGGFVPFWAGLFTLLAVATLLFGHLGAIWQSNFRRFLAYSIIGQSGFMMMGLAAPSVLGLTGLLFHILTHAIAIIGIFAIMAFLETKGMFEIHALDGLGKRSPFLAVALTVLLASLGGVPFLAGFVSKFILLSAAIGMGLVMLAVFALLASIISIFFYFKIVRSMFAGKTQAKPLKVPILTSAIVSASLISIIMLGIFPGQVIEFLVRVVSNLQ